MAGWLAGRCQLTEPRIQSERPEIATDRPGFHATLYVGAGSRTYVLCKGQRLYLPETRLGSKGLGVLVAQFQCEKNKKYVVVLGEEQEILPVASLVIFPCFLSTVQLTRWGYSTRAKMG